MTCNKRRAILSEAQAIQIFQIKLTADKSMHKYPSSVHIGSIFGISEKAVRDIWTGRSWARLTRHLDPRRNVLINKPRKEHREPKNFISRQPSMDFNLDVPVNITSNVFPDTKLEVFDSVDYQLHEWSVGASALLDIVDPFHLDFMSWLATAETISNDL